MKPVKTNTVGKLRHTAKAPNQKAIIRSVASSTAVETGKSIHQIENTLLSKRHKLRKVMLAN